jgi:membrane protein implicated in regulation of membrane protease activity
MEPYVYWFLLALVLLALEMATGTFYMLVVSIALAIGGVVALSGFSMPLQFTFGAVTGVVGTVILRLNNFRHSDTLSSLGLDVGQSVQIVTWRDDGTLRVFYRGTEWDAELESVGISRDQPFYIKATRGSTLILTHSKSQ